MIQPGNFFMNDGNFAGGEIECQELRRQVGIEDAVEVIALARILVQDFATTSAECASEKRAAGIDRAYSAERIRGQGGHFTFLARIDIDGVDFAAVLVERLAKFLRNNFAADATSLMRQLSRLKGLQVQTEQLCAFIGA